MRILSRLLALAVALALAVGGALVAVEIVAAELADDPLVIPYDKWYRSARTNDWSSSLARQVSVALLAAGLVLLLLQVAKRRPAVLAMKPTGAGRSAALQRRGVERSLVRAVSRVDGVASAKATITSSRTRVAATTNRRLPGDLEDRVKRAAEARLAALHLATPPPLSVRLNSRRQR